MLLCLVTELGSLVSGGDCLGSLGVRGVGWVRGSMGSGWQGTILSEGPLSMTMLVSVIL